MLYRLDQLKRLHGARTVLNIERLEIEQNRVYTLIGPNGAGKTSLLQLLAFLDKPSSGSLFFMDRLVNQDEPELQLLRRRVVLLDQNPIMFTGTVRSNLEYGLRIRKLASAERRRRVEEALELVGMENFAGSAAQRLSGGETKRVALARALVLQPEVLLCDEPTANVDLENQERILSIIGTINRERQGSIIFSTHYLSQGQRLADYTLLLQNGELSDIANDNIFRITVVDQGPATCRCQLSGQLLFTLPRHLLPENTTVARLHLDPQRLLLNPPVGDRKEGNLLVGHIVELAQERGRIRLVVDAGVRLSLVLSAEQYRSARPAIGDRAEIFAPHGAVRCTRLERSA